MWPVELVIFSLIVPCCYVLTGTAALEEDAQILKVIEAYCTSAKTRQTLNSSKFYSNVLEIVVVRVFCKSQWEGNWAVGSCARLLCVLREGSLLSAASVV